MPTNAYLQDLLQLDKLSSQFPDSLCDVLSRRDFDEDASNLQTDDDLVEVIEYLDRVPYLHRLHLSSTELTLGAKRSGSR